MFLFLLGLISIMALASMGLAIEKREEEKRLINVKLVGIPAHFVPVHLRCRKDTVDWLDDTGRWQKLFLGELTPGAGRLFSRASKRDLQRFWAFIGKKAAANRRLSFSRRQHTIILWVEPEGVLTALLFVQMEVTQYGIPLRIGKLPVMAKEVIIGAGQPK